MSDNNSNEISSDCKYSVWGDGSIDEMSNALETYRVCGQWIDGSSSASIWSGRYHRGSICICDEELDERDLYATNAS